MFETERLIIRPFTLNDVDDLYECCNDFEMVKTNYGMAWPYTKEFAKQWIQMQEKDENSFKFAVCLKDCPNKVIACVALQNIDKTAKRGEIGCWVARKNWGHGIAPEAMKTIINYGFKDLGLHSIFGRYFTSNLASGRIMEKCGMKYVGKIRDHVVWFDEYCDVGYYDILETDAIE